MLKALITGSNGFIGYHLSKLLLENNWKVIGVDSNTPYYDVTLKQKREAVLKEFSNFQSFENSIEDKNFFDNLPSTFHPNIIIHLAAQAGVRYSISEPETYVNTNLVGTFRILEFAKQIKIKHLLMASSSSVYGSNTDLPFHENQKCDTPLSFYAASKKSNEEMAHSYSHLFSVPVTMFRFFTVYGPWGRPDMALFKFTKNIIEERAIQIFNHGKMERDFTYVSDLVQAIKLLIDKVPNLSNSKSDVIKNDSISNVAPFRIVNIGNSNPVKLMDMIELLEVKLEKKAIKEFIPMQPGDVVKTWSSIQLLKNLTNFEPKISIEKGIGNFVDWYLEYYDM